MRNGTRPARAYGEWLAAASRDWPEDALEAAGRAFIDIVAVTVAGSTHSASRRVFSAVGQWGDGCSTVIGGAMRVPSPWAALANGMAAHVLDYDDNFAPGRAHASAVLAPSILALAEEHRLSGAACVDAFIAGLQIMGRVGEALNPAHRNLGWHPTSTVGAIGAAAGCARLLGLGPDAAGHALSLATSMAGGSMAQHGTMAKPLHAGLAAKAGVIAASLAANGVKASDEALDGSLGMAGLMGGGAASFRTDDIGTPLYILTHGLRAKRFPNCASAHRAMDGLLQIIERHRLDRREIISVRVTAPRTNLQTLRFTAPRNGMEAKFSLEFALAALLVDGTLGLAHFDEAAVARPDIRASFDKIERIERAHAEGDFATDVVVTLDNGASYETTVVSAFGNLENPFGEADYWAKFDDSVGGLAAPDRTAIISKGLAQFAAIPDVTTFMEPLRAPFG